MNGNRFISDFYRNFGHLKEVPIVLYGIGQFTRKIVEQVKDYHIIGLMDAKTIGQKIYGLKVLTEHEAAAAGAIIIVSNLSIAETIYKRIAKFTQMYEIEVYYLNGLQPQVYDSAIANNLYWKKNEEDLKMQILENDIISFDIFDTLLMRRCQVPEDVFWLMDDRDDADEIFVLKRKAAEKKCYQCITKYFNIEQIYDILCEDSQIPIYEKEAMIQREIEVEMHLLVQRESICELLRYAKKHGKTVILTSDMYLGRKVLTDMLQQNGICEYDELLVSCEVKKDKYWGSMWEYVTELFPTSKILHIGDNEISDEKTPKEYGIQTYRIASPNEMLQMSGINQYLGQKIARGDCLLWGLFAAKAVNNPFGMSRTKGKLYIATMYEFGYLFFGPLILNYLLWLIEKVKEQQIDTILFVARDGYLLEKLYQKIIYDKQIEAPCGVYFLSSRRAASVASIEAKEDIWFIFDKLCNTASVKYEKILEKAFGIKIDADDKYMGCALYEVDKEKLFRHTIERYSKRIFKNAEQERINYFKYLETLQLGKQIGFVNFVCRGVTQYCMSKMMKKRMKGFYFASEEDIVDIYPHMEDISCLYGEYLSTHTSRLNLVIKYLYGETIFSSPNGQLIRFSEVGTPIYAERSEGFTEIHDCHMGIEQYIADMMNIISNVSETTFSNEMVDQILGIFDLENVILSEKVKKVFSFEDYYGE